MVGLLVLQEQQVVLEEQEELGLKYLYQLVFYLLLKQLLLVLEELEVLLFYKTAHLEEIVFLVLMLMA